MQALTSLNLQVTIRLLLLIATFKAPWENQDGLEMLSTVLVISVRVDGCDCSLYKWDLGIVEQFGATSHTNGALTMDHALSQQLSDQFFESHSMRLSVSPRDLMRLVEAVREARQHLMSTKRARIHLGRFHNNQDLIADIYKDQLLTLVDNLLVPGIVNYCMQLHQIILFSQSSIVEVLCSEVNV